jgi:hypothetical protein
MCARLGRESDDQISSVQVREWRVVTYGRCDVFCHSQKLQNELWTVLNANLNGSYKTSRLALASADPDGLEDGNPDVR